MNILMVCLGNICRSPIAEGVMKEKIKLNRLNWTVASAGTNGLHTGEQPHRFSQKVCLQHGINIAAQRAQRFTVADFQHYDIIYAMARDVYDDIKRIAPNQEAMDKVKLFLDELGEAKGQSVPDPWYGNESGYLPVYQLIDRTCEAIISKYQQ